MASTLVPAALMAPGTRRLIVAVMLVSTFMVAAETTVIGTAMPTIVAQLGGFELFTWAFGIFVLCQAVTTPIYGRLADLYGRRRVYIGSTALFLVGSLLCGLAWNMPALIVFRAVQGLGGGGLLPLAIIVIGDVSPAADRPRLLSYVSAVWGVAAIIGPLIGSVCVGTVGWPFVFWLNLPVGVATTVLIARHLKEAAPRGDGRIDLPAAGLLMAGVGAGMAALIQWDTLSGRALVGLAAVCAACLAAFAVLERRAREPMLAAHLLRGRTILAGNVSGVLCGALVIGTTAFLPAWVQGVKGDSALVAGFVLGVLTVAWTGTSLSLGRVLGRLSTRAVALAASVPLVLGTAGLLFLGAGGWPLLLACSVAVGIGLGSSSIVFTVAVQAAVQPADRGRATSLFYFSRLLGQAVGAAAFGGVLNAGLAAGGPNTHGALRALMDPVSRGAMSASELARLLPVLTAALGGVFGLAFLVALLTVPIGLIVPRRR